ncbi:MAG: protein TolR [Aquabacterium sp.]|nr:MAG: protein TolR [Aquabacterium sp.]TAL20405.1 MAG: protein TolR [Aquabacterium sp.]
MPSSYRNRGRRTMNEINMVPFIDVMLVLLIIFMVSAPLITTGVVDLPSVGKAKQQPPKVIEVVVKDENSLELRVDGKDAGAVALKDLYVQVQAVQNEVAGGADEVPVVISANKDVRYDVVVQVMNHLQSHGVKRVGLSVKTTGEARP